MTRPLRPGHLMRVFAATGGGPASAALLLESGSYFLLESGSFLLLG